MLFDRASDLVRQARPVGCLLILTASRRQSREPLVGGKHVALHLHQRDRAGRNAAVSMEDRVGTVFPALIGKPGVGGPLVGDETVTVSGAHLLHPGCRPAKRGPHLIDEGHVAGAVGIGGCEIDIERRRVDAAIIAAERQFAQHRHLALARFVHDLAGLGIAEWRRFAGLVHRQE